MVTSGVGRDVPLTQDPAFYHAQYRDGPICQQAIVAKISKNQDEKPPQRLRVDGRYNQWLWFSIKLFPVQSNIVGN